MYLFIFTVLVFLPCHKAEIFTSMADMEQMVLSEKTMLTALKDYILAEEGKLQDIKKFMSRVGEALQYVNETDVGKYLGNPVNSYLMLKRFNVDWKDLEKTLEMDVAKDFNTFFEEMRPYFPTIEDHEGAMDALFRLQKIYKLPSNTLAKGIIPGVSVSKHSLNIQEIFELGLRAYNTQNWGYSVDWFQTALEELGDREMLNTVKRADVVDYLAYALFQNGSIKKAYELTLHLAKLKPDVQRIQDNLLYFHEEVNGLKKDEQGNIIGEVPQDNFGSEYGGDEERRKYMDAYQKLCRGEVRSLTRKEERKMKCWYKTNDPLLRIKPQKFERVWVNPEIFIMRGLVTEGQADYIKRTAYPMLKRATIQDPLTGKLTHANYRVSKSAWLPPNEYALTKRLKRRTQAVTGLDMEYAEHLQVANYGIGGQYDPHFDHARDDEDQFTDLGMGNRIATVLVYLSDVKAGGRTVFTNAHTAISPSKYDAAFWFNLKRNGSGNVMTRHAACPVLVGQKWVSNYWIHSYGQLFRRRCGLNKDW